MNGNVRSAVRRLWAVYAGLKKMSPLASPPTHTTHTRPRAPAASRSSQLWAAQQPPAPPVRCLRGPRAGPDHLDTLLATTKKLKKRDVPLTLLSHSLTLI